MKKQLYLVSLGCSKNLVDAEVMLGLLEAAGYEVCAAPEAADLLLVNTCGFIQSAVEEAIDAILDLSRFKAADPAKLLVVAGCLVQRYQGDLRQELPEVDLFLGTDGFSHIVARLAELTGQRRGGIELGTPGFLMNSAMPRRISTPRHRAYLKVTEGCDNRCTYCMIPSIRGGLRSRSVADLRREAIRLEEAGVRELTFIAQDLTAYGLDLGKNGPRLVSLLDEILAATAIPWLRLLYLYPHRVSDALLTMMAEQPRVLSYLDIPLQHVNSGVLRRMNRPYGRAEIDALLGRIRARLPAAAIRTTFMVGFPGETEEDVRELERFMAEQRLDHVGVFAYSNEEGCAAAQFPNQCAEEEKEERLGRLMNLQAEISAAKNEARLGTVAEVLVEGASRETELLLEGRAWFQAPDVDGCVYINEGECNPGDLVRVRFSEAHIYDLVGEIVA